MPLGHSWYQWEDPTRSLRMLVRRLETQNSILVGRDVFHYIKAEGMDAAVAWSGDNDDVHFNSSKLPPADTREDIMFITGVNHHEVAHLIYSPTIQDMRDLWPRTAGPNEAVDKFLNDRPYQAVWNFLEDQRIEMLMVKRFSNMRPYLMTAFTRIVLVENKRYINTAYLLARGRRYLPIRIRRMLKRRFGYPKIIPDVRRIIDEYCTLNTFRSDGFHRSHLLVLEMMQLLKDNQVGADNLPPHEACREAEQMVHREHDGGFGSDPWHHKQPTDTHADDVAADEMQELLDDVAKQIAEENSGQDSDTESKPDHDGDSDGGDPLNDAAGLQGSDPADLSGPGQKSGQQGSQGGQNGQDAEDAGGTSGDNAGDSGSGVGRGGSASPGSKTEDIAAEMARAIVSVMAAQNIGEEIRQVEAMIRMGHDIDAPKVRDDGPVEDELRGVARRLEKAMRVKENEVDPFWNSHQTQGKLNVQRLIRNPDDRDHAFDRWEEGGIGGVDQEWVVLLDVSGSMKHAGHLVTLSKMAWVMKRAADLVEARMTVVAYGSAGQQELVYDPNARAAIGIRPVLPDLGGTEPLEALIEAYRVLSHSKRKVKGLMVMTDGNWDRQYGQIPRLETPEKVIQELNSVGVQTHLAHLTGPYSQYTNAHNCQTAQVINSVAELPQMMKDLITGRMKRV